MVAEVKRLTDRRGADVVVEHVGAATFPSRWSPPRAAGASSPAAPPTASNRCSTCATSSGASCRSWARRWRPRRACSSVVADGGRQASPDRRPRATARPDRRGSPAARVARRCLARSSWPCEPSGQARRRIEAQLDGDGPGAGRQETTAAPTASSSSVTLCTVAVFQLRSTMIPSFSASASASNTTGLSRSACAAEASQTGRDPIGDLDDARGAPSGAAERCADSRRPSRRALRRPAPLCRPRSSWRSRNQPRAELRKSPPTNRPRAALPNLHTVRQPSVLIV